MTSPTRSVGFQYASARHQADTAANGMWLFLASEVLFFGALWLCWICALHGHPVGFETAVRLTALPIGTLNTVLLLTSSLAYSLGLMSLRAGRVRAMLGWCALTAGLGVAFIALKLGLEWRDDWSRHLFPGAGFAIHGAARAGAEQFFVLYFVATGVHAVHLLVGVGLVVWIMQGTRRGRYTARSLTPVAAVGLYWSFVDLVWLVLFPLIYLVGRGT